MPSTKRCILASQRPIHALHSAAIVRAFSVVCQLQNLRSFSQERQAQITALERRVSELEMHLRDSEQKVQQHQIEKNHMAQEMKAMQRDMSKLDQVELPRCRTGGLLAGVSPCARVCAPVQTLHHAIDPRRRPAPKQLPHLGPAAVSRGHTTAWALR